MASYPSILAWKILWSESLTGYNPWVAKSQTQVSTHTHSVHVILAVLVFVAAYRLSLIAASWGYFLVVVLSL